MHCLDSGSRIWIVGAYFFGTSEGEWMGDNWEFFSESLGLFLVFSLFYYYIIHIQTWRAVLRVHDVGIDHWHMYFRDGHSGCDRTLCLAILWLIVWYLYTAEGSRMTGGIEPFLACGDPDCCTRKPISSSAACLSPAMLSSEFMWVHGFGSFGGWTSQDIWMITKIKRRITTMLFIISILCFLYTTL
jgi:hypothetical protein